MGFENNQSRFQPFTRNHEDNSSESGFQFTFYCDICHDGYKTRFIESKTYKQTGLFGMFGRAISTGSALVGQYRIGNAIERSVDILNDRKQGMSPEWRKEWEEAFELAQNEAKQHFCRCSRCKKYVCESDWNEQDNLCVECAPRENVELTAIRAERMVSEMREKAETANVFKGDIERRQTVCPECGKPAGEGKFCNNCGASIALAKCPSCGNKVSLGTKFCGECGTKLN